MKGQSKAVIWAGILLLALGLQRPAAAAENALSGLQIIEQKDAVIVEIDFAIPVKYVKHFPPKEGEILQIQLQATGEKALKRESLTPPPSDLVPLALVTYEGDIPGGPYVTIRFNYGVEYSVEEAAGNSILVTIKRDTLGLSVRGQADEQPLMSEKKLDEMMEEAKQVLAKGDDARAIQLFTQLLRLPSNKYTQESKELLGLARERKGQVARARIEYQEYLRIYPEGEGAARVKQRLAALNDQLMQPRQRLKRVDEAGPASDLVTFGRFSQRYYNDTTEFKKFSRTTVDANNDPLVTTFPGRTTERETLTSFINLSSRMRTQDYDIRGIFNMHDIKDLQDEDRSETRLNNLYVDVKNVKDGFGVKAGRQSSTKGGIFGRFDGLWGDYELTKGWTLSAAAGKPVEFSSNAIIADKKFYGLNLALGTFAQHWDGNLYYVNQDVNSMVDRRAVGGDVRYNDDTYSVYNAIDYDVAYGMLNMYLFRGVMKVSDDLRWNISYNYRLSPILFSTNALQQEGIVDFSLLQNEPGVSEQDILDKAKAVSSVSRSTTVGAVYQIEKDMQLNADVTWTKFDGKPATERLIPSTDPNASNTIEGTGPNGPDLLYSAQVIASNYFVDQDINILGLRFSDRKHRDSLMVFYNNRFPLGEKWRIGPRIQREDTRITTEGDRSELTRMTYVAKLDYRLLKKVSLEGEFGYETSTYANGNNPDYERYYFYLGYFWDF